MSARARPGGGWAWEATLLVLTLAAAGWASFASPFYLSFDQITYSLQQSIAVTGLLALGLMVIIVVGEIDISLPAIMALGNIVLAQQAILGVPVWLAVPAVVLIGAALGALNGLLVVRFGLPSLAVTLGAMGAYRALALLLGGQESFASFPDSYTWLGFALIGGVFPASLALLLVLAGAFALLMHRTVFGRLTYVVGSNARAAAFSGVRVARIKILAFVVGGATAGLTSLVYVGQYQSARADNATDMLLLIVTAVVLGGVDIFGGRGRVVGVLLSLVLLGTLQNGMGLINLPGPVQTLAIGALLIGSVLIAQSGDPRRWSTLSWLRTPFMGAARNRED